VPGYDPTTQIITGRTLGGRYRLVAPIARGGMAEVWEGYDDVLSRAVAVKVLQPHLAADGVFLERFRREAVTAARLTHPGIVATFDTGLDSGAAYIVMELVRGRNLRQLLSDHGRIEPWQAVAVARQISDALAYAHQAGLVHRDVKPANILLVEDEWGSIRVKVTDFGIAKAGAATGGDLTRTGIVLGTPKYLSPEQIKGGDPDPRADIYSLGVVLFEMLTGTAPYVGDTDMATALAHLNDKVPHPGARVKGIPSSLDRLVVDLLAKNPDRRVPTASVLRQRLDSLGPLAPPGTAVGGLGWRNSRRTRDGTGGQAHQTPSGVPRPPIYPTPPATPAPGSGPIDVPAAWIAAPPASMGVPPARIVPPPPPPMSTATPTPGGPANTTARGSAGNGASPAAAPPWPASASPAPTSALQAPTSAPAAPISAPPAPTPASSGPAASLTGAGGAPSSASPPASGPGAPRPYPAPGPSQFGVPQRPTTDQLEAGRPPARRFRRSERNAGLVVVGLVVVGALVAAVLLSSRGHAASHNHAGGTAPANPVASRISISGVNVFMVNNRPPDDPQDTKNVFDGNTATVWSTDSYHSSTFGNLYPGIGLAIELNSTATVHRLTVSSPTSGWSAESFVSAAPVATGQPVTAWGQPTDAKSSISNGTSMDLGGKRARYVLLWITNLGPIPYRVEISEVGVS
jgi:serine/threonine-protein kinase